MNYISQIIILFTGALTLAACGPSPIKHTEGNTAYTQIGLWAEGRVHLATNYAKGDFIPVNTKVRIAGTNSDAIDFIIIETSKPIKLVNIEAYTGKNMQGFYDRYFASSLVDLSEFDATVRDNILHGDIEPGMSKAAVLLARGYPPVHRTYSTKVICGHTGPGATTESKSHSRERNWSQSRISYE